MRHPIPNHQIRPPASRLHQLRNIPRVMLPIPIQSHRILKPLPLRRFQSLPQSRPLPQIPLQPNHPCARPLRLGARSIRAAIIHHPNRRHKPQHGAHDCPNAPNLVEARYDSAQFITFHDAL